VIHTYQVLVERHLDIPIASLRPEMVEAEDKVGGDAIGCQIFLVAVPFFLESWIYRLIASEILIFCYLSCSLMLRNVFIYKLVE